MLFLVPIYFVVHSQVSDSNAVCVLIAPKLRDSKLSKRYGITLQGKYGLFNFLLSFNGKPFKDS